MTSKVYKTLIFILLILILSVTVIAQEKGYTTKKKRAVKRYELALRAYDRYDFDMAEKELMNALKIDKNFIEAHLFLSQVYQTTKYYDKAIEAAERAIAINPNFFPNIYFSLGDMLLKTGNYSEAIPHLEKFLGYNRTNKEMREQAALYLKNCHFALQAQAKPVPFEPINLGPSINTPLDEYWPSLSASENTLVITVRKPMLTPTGEPTGRHQEDFYITHRNEHNEWIPVSSVGPPINTPQFNEGAQSLTADGKTMYYTICRGVCNLYVSRRDEEGNWGNPQTLPEPVNLPYTSEKQPSISPDGKTLYFVSNRPEGLGHFDIWRSQKLEGNKWSKPENLGDSINTKYNEQSPFIHFDNQTLYFSSNGRVGMGGLDIYMSKQVNDSTWSSPKNLGYPINTHNDEDGLIVNAMGTMAYYSSDIDPEMGRDIFKFYIPKEIQPTPTSYISGKITDARSGWPLKANFSMIDLSSEKAIAESQARTDGTFFLTIPTNRSYAFFASSPGYLFHSEHFDLLGIHSADKPFRKDIELNPIRIGGTMVMRNIFFETDSYLLKDESIAELKKIFELLNLNPSVKIEVGGHTDNVGSASYNLTLSENRARSVAQFLFDRGIAQSRITWKGYGLAKPIGDNTTEDGRAENRRTEIRITGI
ncbi:MAG: OmpA family protein [Tenuifilaceae bacterium]|jgi:tetratricopeptide (TPR) repeat protein|nr:OmpA family protein [Tenuifilaceae bacterium]